MNSDKWGARLIQTSLATSVTTGLIVLRIVKVYLEVRSTSEDRDLGAGGGNGKTSVYHHNN